MLGWISLKAVGWLLAAGGYCSYRWLMRECCLDEELLEKHLDRSKHGAAQGTEPVQQQRSRPTPRIRALLPGEVTVSPPHYKSNNQGDQSV